MKLAFICTEKLPAPAIKGGAIQMMIDGVTPFLAQIYELVIFSIEDESLPQTEQRGNVHYIRFPREHYRESVATELPKHAFDIIHVFNRPANVPIYKAASPNSAIFLSLHNDMFAEKKISDELGKQAIENSFAIMTVSNYIKQTIIERFPAAKEKIKIVYSGVDLSAYPPIWTEDGKAIREAYKKKYQLENKKVILFVGRLSKSKGPHILIEAMKQINVEYPDAVLVIVGGKWFSDNRVNKYVQYLYKLARPLKDKIIFTNFIPANEIPHIFLMADVCICSSQWNEPLARVNYEAMAAGIPLISTNRGGNGEVVLHKFNGLLIENYQSPSAFAIAIDSVLSQPDTAEWLGKNARSLIEKNFTFYHTATRLCKVYQLAGERISLSQ